MSKDFSAELQQAKQIADELRQQLRLYQESIRDPDATISLPDMNRMCQLADALIKKLDVLQ
ncbi:MAG: hypothetical protein A3I78_00440 [Gammaproteobacteria bacterium RIFCSPLOWO2_02_FULL_56_15]|nr:MAG: hypothetical protein A3I78_00440 [Gammaproteobacteria bacterium RIFCSPLOWO2_02_FULL_56_15]